VQRLQEITYQDTQAEGIEATDICAAHGAEPPALS
jgi:hypothetical protein